MSPHAPAWLDARIRAYGTALGASARDIEAALRAAAHAPTPAAALAVARALLVGVATPARADGAPPQREPNHRPDHAPDHEPDHTPGGVPLTESDGGDAALTDLAWAGGLAAAQGVVGDPQRAWLAQDLAVLRTPVAAQPFRRRPLRRLVSGLLLRPLARLLRPAQLLSGRVAD